MVLHHLLGGPLDDEAQLFLYSPLDGLWGGKGDSLYISHIYFSSLFAYIIIIKKGFLLRDDRD